MNDLILAHGNPFDWPEAIAVAAGCIAAAWVLVAFMRSDRFR